MGYNTRQRERILACLMTNRSAPITADELAERLRGEGVGRTTVYRQLEKMWQEGLIKRFPLSDGTGVCYQFVGDPEACHEHMHCRCVVCGQLVHVDCEHFEELREHLLSEHHFVLDAQSTVLAGRCAECARKEEAANGAADAKKRDPWV